MPENNAQAWLRKQNTEKLLNFATENGLSCGTTRILSSFNNVYTFSSQSQAVHCSKLNNASKLTERLTVIRNDNFVIVSAFVVRPRHI